MLKIHPYVCMEMEQIVCSLRQTYEVKNVNKYGHLRFKIQRTWDNFEVLLE